jgi:hypothetical protein
VLVVLAGEGRSMSSAQLASRAGCDMPRIKAACNWLCCKGFIRRTHRIIQQKSETHIPEMRSHRQKIVFWDLDAKGTTYIVSLQTAATAGVLSGMGL